MADNKDKTEKQVVTDETQNANEIASEIIAKAREEAAEILAKAMGEVEDIEDTKEAENHIDDEAYWNELVEVKLFKDNDKYKDDVFVAVNGESLLIQRGKTVKVKRKFAQVLANSDSQDVDTAEYLRILQSEFDNKKGKLE